MDSQDIIKLKDVVHNYQLGKVTIPALRGLTLTIAKGSSNSIVGPSGCGKTTTLNLIGCIDTPTSGYVEVDNQQVATMREDQLTEFRSRTIGFIFQNFNLIPVLNVFENVAYPLTISKFKKKEIQKRVHAALESTGILSHARHKPNELSGGQRQRVAIARALVIEPKLIIADEPTANLDSKTGEKILTLLRDLQEKRGTSLLFASHDNMIAEFVENVYSIKDGIIVDHWRK